MKLLGLDLYLLAEEGETLDNRHTGTVVKTNLVMGHKAEKFTVNDEAPLAGQLRDIHRVSQQLEILVHLLTRLPLRIPHRINIPSFENFLLDIKLIHTFVLLDFPRTIMSIL